MLERLGWRISSRTSRVNYLLLEEMCQAGFVVENHHAAVHRASAVWQIIKRR
jgi:hypothetical protein